MTTPETPQVTLIHYADALVEKLRVRLPDIPAISADPPPRQQRSLKMPAVYLEIDDFEPIAENGDSRALVDARWKAYCHVDPNCARADLQVRALAARVVVALHEIRRPVPGHGHIRLARAGDDPFKPELDGYLTWVVEFGIEIALGELEPEPARPTEIYLGVSPAIGANHIDGYERIA